MAPVKSDGIDEGVDTAPMIEARDRSASRSNLTAFAPILVNSAETALFPRWARTTVQPFLSSRVATALPICPEPPRIKALPVIDLFATRNCPLIAISDWVFAQGHPDSS